jgi:hypothetical protein
MYIIASTCLIPLEFSSLRTTSFIQHQESPRLSIRICFCLRPLCTLKRAGFSRCEDTELLCTAQAAVSILAAQGRVTLQPHLGSSISLVSSSSDFTPSTPTHSLAPASNASATAADQPKSQREGASTARGVLPRTAAPWIFPSGALNRVALRSLLRQVSALLAAFPGIPEDLLAEKMSHALGRMHLRRLLSRMEAAGAARCAALPRHASAVVQPDECEGLRATPRGFVPAIFGGGERRLGAGGVGGGRGKQDVVVLPLDVFYFGEVSMSLEDMVDRWTWI